MSICVTNMFDNRPFSFYSLNDRQSKIRLHAVNDTTTAKIYKLNDINLYTPNEDLITCTRSSRDNALCF